jgi:hypothetical protein
MMRIAIATIVPFLLALGCAEGGTSDSKTTVSQTCDPAIAMMVTGSQSVIGTRIISKITNASGQSVQETGASGCSSSSSVCEVAAGLYMVGGNFTGQLAGVGIGTLTQAGLIAGPSNGQCSEDQTVTIDTNHELNMAVYPTGLIPDSGSPYVVYITAIWPAS